MLRLATLLLVALAAATGSHGAYNAQRVAHEAIVESVNSNPASTWRAGLNDRFVHMETSAIRRMMGTRPTPAAHRLPERAPQHVDALPESFDARVQWPQCPSIAQIRDQSSCGACWAFGAVEAASDRICIETNGATQAMLSANDLLACCDTCGQGCDGGFLPQTWKYLVQTGVVTGGNYNDSTTDQWCEAYTLPNCNHHEGGRYQPCGSPEYSTPKCVSQCDASTKYKTPFGQDHHKFTSAYSVPANAQAIATEIFLNGPVEGAFTVFMDFLTYKSGVYQHQTGSEDGGHAIKV